MAEHNARILPFFVAISLTALGCGGPLESFREEPAPPGVGVKRAPLLDSDSLPGSVSYQLALPDRSLELLLELAPSPTAAGYRNYTLNADGQLVEQAFVVPTCSYRGRARTTDANGLATSGFVSVSLCAAATGYALGQALNGVLMMNGQLWDLSPVAGDTDASNGIEHQLSPSRRGGTLAASTAEKTAEQPVASASVGALTQLPVTPNQILRYREGTSQETKYVEVLLVNDAARVAQRGSQTQADGLLLIEAANALLDESNLTPRVRMVLAAQVNFTVDPYPLFSNDLDGAGNPVPLSSGQEVDHTLQLQTFLDWASTAQLPAHDEHMLLSGQDFFQNSAGLAPVAAACLVGQNGFLVQAENIIQGSGLGFSILSTVHELGHTLGMGHDPSAGICAQETHIMSAVGCANCPIGGIDFSVCSQQDFTAYLQSANYLISSCADDLPAAPPVASCGDGVVSGGEACDCGSDNCIGIDPCCDGASCQLLPGAACSDYNDGCCALCQIVGAAEATICRAQRSECDTAEICTGISARCPDDTFLDAGGACRDPADNEGVCFFGNCRSRTPQCQQLGALLEAQETDFDGNLSAPTSACAQGCETVICTGAPGSNIGCLTISGTVVTEGVACDGGQCVNGSCIALVDQCPNNAEKTEPGECGCELSDDDSDNDGTLNCFDACPADPDKQAEGSCGCSVSEVDSDSDGTPDCIDECPNNAAKVSAGLCGCANSEADDDQDGVPNCADECPLTPGQVVEGACGCGLSDADRDGDGVADCNDACPDDANASSRPCPANNPVANDESETASEGDEHGNDEDEDDRVVLVIETKTGFLCSLTETPRSSSAPSGAWLLSLAALLVARKRRSVSRLRH